MSKRIIPTPSEAERVERWTENTLRFLKRWGWVAFVTLVLTAAFNLFAPWWSLPQANPLNMFGLLAMATIIKREFFTL